MLGPESVEWSEATTAEVNSLLKNGTFEKMILPPGRIGTKVVHRKKIDVNGVVVRFKARICVLGYLQRVGVDSFFLRRHSLVTIL